MVTHSNKQSGLVLEHRLIMAEYLGRTLNKDEVVHHINGIKSDNRVCNLKVLKQNKHNSHMVTKDLQIRVQQLEDRMVLIEAENTILHKLIGSIWDSVNDNNLNIQRYKTPSDSLDRVIEGIVHTSSNGRE